MAAALLAVWVLWGTTYLGIRVMVGVAPPLFAAGLRFTVAGALMLVVVAWRSRGGPTVRERLRGRLRRLALLGVLHFLVANGLVSVAERQLPSATAGVLFATVPLWLLLVRALDGARPVAADLGAAGTGVLGVALLLGFQPGSLLPSLQVLAAAAAWAVAGHLAGHPRAGRVTGPEPGTALVSAVQMLAGGLALLLAAGGLGEWGQVRPGLLGPSFWTALSYLVVLGSLVGFWAYSWLTAHVDQRLASTYAYVNPVVAVLLGSLLLGERLGAGALLGTALIAAAVAWNVRTRAAAADAARAAADPASPSPRHPARADSPSTTLVTSTTSTTSSTTVTKTEPTS